MIRPPPRSPLFPYPTLFRSDHVLPGDVAAFANGVRHFAGLAQTEPDAAVLVPGDDQRAEAETASAFHHLGGTIDVNHLDRKSTRLNSSHSQISYAVFCLKKK